jgi:hypothetical protein
VIFDIKTLRQLQTRGNHEIVSFMAPKWEFRDSDAKSLLHLEEMGFPIDRDKLLKTLSGWSDNFYFECSALYALQSPEFSLDDLQSCFRDLKGKHEKWFNALEASYRELPKAIRNAHIDEKLRASLIALASMEPLPKGYPDALLKINGLGREEAIEIPALAELLLCSDLGL